MLTKILIYTIFSEFYHKSLSFLNNVHYKLELNKGVEIVKKHAMLESY